MAKLIMRRLRPTSLWLTSKVAPSSVCTDFKSPSMSGISRPREERSIGLLVAAAVTNGLQPLVVSWLNGLWRWEGDGRILHWGCSGNIGIEVGEGNRARRCVGKTAVSGCLRVHAFVEWRDWIILSTTQEIPERLVTGMRPTCTWQYTRRAEPQTLFSPKIRRRVMTHNLRSNCKLTLVTPCRDSGCSHNSLMTR